MMNNYEGYNTLAIDTRQGVAFVSLNNPPLNVLDVPLMMDLGRFVATVQQDKDIKVIVFSSADPDYFIMHGDVNFIVNPAALMADVDPAMADPLINPMQQLHEQIRQLPQVTIAVIDGYVRGGGHEFVLACNMRFGSLEKAKMAQPEALMGIIPGGGGTQYLTRLIGKARALEVILGAELIDAKLAEQYGFINRALPQQQLYSHVETLALRIAGLPEGVVAAVVEAVDAASGEVYDGLAVENRLCMGLFMKPETVIRAKAGLEKGAQTREGEKDLEGILNSI
jgi:enoyl-CoA hydratase/carnithine racemase